MDKQEIIEARYGGWEPGDAERIGSIIRLAGSNNTILDVGCGTGLIGGELKKNGNTVYGVDYSRQAVKNAVKRGVIAKAADIEHGKIPFKDNFFDGVVLGEIIEHIYDTDAFLQKVRQKIKPGGFMIVTTPNLATFGRRVLLLFGKNPHIEYYFREDSAGHIKYFIRDTLTRLLRENGFEIGVFTSDEVNFTASGKVQSKLLARMFPTLGRTLIVKAIKSRQAK
jgi:2-polyprenyl-3-methyl-5-hydroxy-6-metoxy-1,4-benzoquinol methylase